MNTQTTAPSRANLEPLRLACGLFETAESDKTIWEYCGRVAATVARLQPGPVAACEWAGETWPEWMRKGGHAPTGPAAWRESWPALYVGEGCESPIIGLDLCTGTRNAEQRFSIWRAKTFDHDSALALITFFACATVQICLPDPAGIICRTCRGAGRHWTKEAQAVIPCAVCNGTGATLNKIDVEGSYFSGGNVTVEPRA